MGKPCEEKAGESSPVSERLAMQYRFHDAGDDELIAVSELPVEDGIAVALRTTGYDAAEDEIVELSIVDFSGDELFSRKVKPQNVEEWAGSEASGGITPADVADSPELYQFEDEIIELFENASIVVAPYADFAEAMVEASWVSLPKFEKCSLIGLFCETHSSSDYPGEPAAAATLGGVCDYYGVPHAGPRLVDTARAAAQCYLKLVDEHARERVGKGEAHWERYRLEQEQARQGDAELQRKQRAAEMRTVRVNAFLWLCAAAIFSNLSVQLWLRGFNVGIVIVIAFAAAYFVVRWVMCLVALYKLRN